MYTRRNEFKNNESATGGDDVRESQMSESLKEYIQYEVQKHLV